MISRSSRLRFHPSKPPPAVQTVQLHIGGGTRLGRYMQFLDKLDSHLSSNSYDIVHAMLPVRQCDIYHPHAGIAAEAVRSGPSNMKADAADRVADGRIRMNLKRRRFASSSALLPARARQSCCCLSNM